MSAATNGKQFGFDIVHQPEMYTSRLQRSIENFNKGCGHHIVILMSDVEADISLGT